MTALHDIAEFLGYVGAIIALVLLWHYAGRRRLSSHRWFIILPVSIAGATAAGLVPTYHASVAFAALINEPLDVAAMLGEACGLGIASGTTVGVVVIIGNAVRRQSDRRGNPSPAHFEQ